MNAFPWAPEETAASSRFLHGALQQALFGNCCLMIYVVYDMPMYVLA
jgi:hypothetical protein